MDVIRDLLTGEPAVEAMLGCVGFVFAVVIAASVAGFVGEYLRLWQEGWKARRR